METEFPIEYDSMTSMTTGGGDAALAAFGMGLMLFLMIFVLVIYVYMAICLVKIAKKTNTPNEWLAWIPVANFILMIQIAKKPMWWIASIFLVCIPFLGAIAFMAVTVLIWMTISERLGRDKWLGILMIVPIANLVLPGYLAFTETPTAAISASPQPGLDPVATAAEIKQQQATAPGTPAAPEPEKKKKPVDLDPSDIGEETDTD